MRRLLTTAMKSGGSLGFGLRNITPPVFVAISWVAADEVGSTDDSYGASVKDVNMVELASSVAIF